MGVAVPIPQSVCVLPHVASGKIKGSPLLLLNSEAVPKSCD